MKLMDKISLRMRVTLLTGTVLVICSVILSITASRNANAQFESLSATGQFGSPTGEGMAYQRSASDAEGHIYTVVTAKEQFNTQSIIMLTIVCVLGTGMVYIVAGRSLRPIRILSKTISTITERDLHNRVAEDNRSDEVAILGRSFNTMLDRIEASFLRQKRFSANVAHELKTPLAIINAGIQVLNLDDNPSDVDCKKTLNMTENNINRLIAVVDDLMQLCDEQDEFETVQIDIRGFFDTICKELSPLIEEKGIEIECNYRLHSIKANPLVYRAFFNLLENGIKYNRFNGRLSIETSLQEGVAKIKISDTGEGIPKDELPYIFEPFYRVNKSRSRKLGGAGLGLSIVKMIIDKHGWEIMVDSIEGTGSVFTIIFNA